MADCAAAAPTGCRRPPYPCSLLPGRNGLEHDCPIRPGQRRAVGHRYGRLHTAGRCRGPVNNVNCLPDGSFPSTRGMFALNVVQVVLIPVAHGVLSTTASRVSFAGLVKPGRLFRRSPSCLFISGGIIAPAVVGGRETMLEYRWTADSPSRSAAYARIHGIRVGGAFFRYDQSSQAIRLRNPSGHAGSRRAGCRSGQKQFPQLMPLAILPAVLLSHTDRYRRLIGDYLAFTTRECQNTYSEHTINRTNIYWPNATTARRRSTLSRPEWPEAIAPISKNDVSARC